MRPSFPITASILLFGPLLGLRPVRAQSPQSGAGETVQAFLRAVHSGFWVEAAGYLYLQDMETIRAEALMSPREPLTVEGMLKSQPEMPLAVAEYYVAQSKRQASTFDRPMFWEFPMVQTREALQDLSLEEVAAAWLEGAGWMGRIRTWLRQQGCTVPEEFLEKLRPPSHRFIGVLPLYQDTTLVVTESPMREFVDGGGPGLEAHFAVTMVVPTPAGFRIRPNRRLIEGQGGLLGLSPELCPRPKRP